LVELNKKLFDLILSKDLNRLWIRNLGRDDRAISDNGKECRYPFLDEIVVSEIAKLNFKILTNFDLPKGGGGEKLLLRKVARKMGLKLILLKLSKS